MLLIHGNTDIIRVITGSAADIEPNISVMQVDASTPPVVQPIAAGLNGPRASITTATTITVIDATGITNGHVLNWKHGSFYNNHASQATTFRVEHNDGTLTSILANVNLLAGEWLIFTQGGVWLHYDSNGGLYPSVGNAASQAEMEGGVATDKYVTPQGINWHPGVEKFWVKCGITGNVLASWNVTSLTDNGVGDVSVTIATGFSSVDYCCGVTVEMTATTYAVANARTPHIRFGGQAVGTLRCDCIDGTATTQLVKDPTAWHIRAVGDQ